MYLCVHSYYLVCSTRHQTSVTMSPPTWLENSGAMSLSSAHSYGLLANFRQKSKSKCVWKNRAFIWISGFLVIVSKFIHMNNEAFYVLGLGPGYHITSHQHQL